MVRSFPHTVGIVVAAGSGRRLGSKIPKAFVPVRGVSMARRSLELLCASGVFSSLVLVVPAEGDYWSADDSRAVQTATQLPFVVIPGGATRQLSVKEALRYCREAVAEAEFVAVHDAARCLTPPSVVRCVVEAAWAHGAATAAVPSVDTLRRVGSARTIIGEVDRADVWQIQTPQAFRVELLWRGHQLPSNGATDDSSLVTPFHPVTVVEGSRLGLKITTPEDLMFAEANAG